MQFSFILVEPAVPGNIGAAARALNTMGYTDLRLVKPCDHLSEEARMLAHGSNDILENAGLYSSLETSLEGIDIAIATTAKKRQARVEYLPASDLPGFLEGKGKSINTVGIVFGKEESGLSNDEIRKCDVVSSIPMARPYPSLNLGQAVMLYAYILSEYTLEPVRPVQQEPVDEDGFRKMMNEARMALSDMGFQDSPAIYNRLLERLAYLGMDDIHLLHSVLNRYQSLK